MKKSTSFILILPHPQPLCLGQRSRLGEHSRLGGRSLASVADAGFHRLRLAASERGLTAPARRGE